MKKGIIVLLAVIIVAAGVFVFSSKYREKENSQVETSAVYEPEEHTVTEESHDGVIAECKEADYKLVIEGKKALVIHGEYTVDMTKYYNIFLKEAPTFHCFDFDGDGEKEVILRRLYQQTRGSSGNVIDKSYKLYIFVMRKKNSTGESYLGYREASSDLWKYTFENYITCEFTQLKSCEKFLQFAMNNKGEEIKYDEKTGITDNKYSGYASAAKSQLGEYYTLDKWSKGLGTYSIDDEGNITLDIQVLASYKESDLVEEIGFIRCSVAYDDKSGFSIVPNTIVFIPRDDKRVADPREDAKSKWSTSLTNLSQSPASDTHIIDWIENSFDVSSMNESESRYFSELDSQIKFLDSIVFNQDSIVLTAKENYTFASNIVNTQRFTITAKLDGKKNYDIGYKCSVDTAGTKEVLTITFDKSYDKSELKDLSISFAG